MGQGLGFLPQKRERGTDSGSPSQVFVVNAVAASAGRCQRCAPQERCSHSTVVCIPGGVRHTSFPVSILPSYSSTRRIAIVQTTGSPRRGCTNVERMSNGWCRACRSVIMEDLRAQSGGRLRRESRAGRPSNRDSPVGSARPGTLWHWLQSRPWKRPAPRPVAPLFRAAR